MKHLDYYIQKIILSFICKKTFTVILSSKYLLKLFDVLTLDKYWKNEKNIISPIGINYYKLKYNICFDCTKRGSTFFNYILCGTCKQNDKYNVISLTKAKKEYYLTDDALSKLKPMIKYSRLYKKDITLYLESDIETISNNTLIEKNNKIKQKRSNRRDELRANRQEELIMQFKKYGLKLRNDSILCANYIEGNKNLTLQDVIQEMCIMKYLFEYTEYPQLMRENREIRSSIERSNLVKSIILEEIGGKWPDPMPWLKGKTIESFHSDKIKMIKNLFKKHDQNEIKLIDIWNKCKKDIHPMKKKELYSLIETEFEAPYKKRGAMMINIEKYKSLY